MMSETSLTIPQEFVLMILNEQSGYFHQVEGWTLNCAIIGAVLAELSLKSRIDTDATTLLLVDATKTGDPSLDLCLETISSHSSQQETTYWIEQLAVHSEYIIDTILQSLVQLEILTRHDGDFYTTNHCEWHAELEKYPSSKNVGNYINSRIAETITATNLIPDPRDSFLISLLNACGILHYIFDFDDEYIERIDLINRIELINRTISDAVQQTAISPKFKRPAFTRSIPKLRLKSLISNRHLWDGNLSALFANLSEEYGPVFKIEAPLRRSRTVLAGPSVNDWVRRNSRKFLTPRHYFRGIEGICGAGNLIASVDGGDHFRLRKVLGNVFSKKQFCERLDDMHHASCQFMTAQDWRAGSELELQRDARLLTSAQLFEVLISTDAQDLIENLIKWNERAVVCYVGDILPRFLAHTPAMNRRFRLYGKLMQRIEENHLPFQRAGRARELSDELLSLHNSDPQLMPEANLTFMSAVFPALVSGYLGDLLGFALVELAKQAHICQRIRNEASLMFAHGRLNVDAFASGQFDVTRRFVMECLRLYPTFGVCLRDVSSSCVFEGYSLPLNERLHIVQTAPHYMGNCFPDPYKFDIDRYLPPRNEHNSSAYAPYGLDAHSCIGQVWANLQLAFTLLIITRHFEFVAVPEDYRVKISPFPGLSVTRKLRLRIARQLEEFSS